MEKKSDLLCTCFLSRTISSPMSLAAMADLVSFCGGGGVFLFFFFFDPGITS